MGSESVKGVEALTHHLFRDTSTILFPGNPLSRNCLPHHAQCSLVSRCLWCWREMLCDQGGAVVCTDNNTIMLLTTRFSKRAIANYIGWCAYLHWVWWIPFCWMPFLSRQTHHTQHSAVILTIRNIAAEVFKMHTCIISYVRICSCPAVRAWEGDQQLKCMFKCGVV